MKLMKTMKYSQGKQIFMSSMRFMVNALAKNGPAKL